MRSDQIDVLDLIIETLREHEKVIDGIVRRLEVITPMLEKELNK